MLQRTLATMRDLIASRRTYVAGLIALTVASGCSVVGQQPSIADDGSIDGGEPRLSSLLEMISKARPADRESEHQCVHYVVSIYPVRHLVVLEGVLPRTRDKVMANYTMIASVDSAGSAKIAIITESTVKPGIEENSPQRSQAFRWERNHWVAKSFAELQTGDPKR